MSKINSYFIVGLSSSGKTTLGRKMTDLFRSLGHQCMLLDGNDISNFNVLDKYDGYDLNSRKKRGIKLANLVNFIKNNGIIPIVAVIGQPPAVREYWKNNIENYFEIHLSCDIEVCRNRDNKDIYDKAIKGRLQNVIGIDIDYIPPQNSNIEINTSNKNETEVFKIIKEELNL